MNKKEVFIAVYYILIALLLLWGIHILGTNKWNEQYLSKQNSTYIKGFFAIVIILHHLSQELENPGSLVYMEECGVLCVGIFFFYSGYGLIKSLNTKENYLQGFLKHRLSVILTPFFIINIIYVLVYAATRQYQVQNLTPVQFLCAMLGIILLNGNAWYIIAITVFYLVFYLLFRFIKNKTVSYFGMFLFLCFYITGCLLSKHGYSWFQGEWWYNTSMVFLFGMLYGNFEKSWNSFFQKKYRIFLPASILGFALLFWRTHIMLQRYSYWAENLEKGITGYKECWICFSWQMPAVLFFVWMCILLLMKIEIKNKALEWIGKISLELYLIHGLFISTLHSNVINIKNNYLYIISVYLYSLIAAAVIWKGIDLCRNIRSKRN